MIRFSKFVQIKFIRRIVDSLFYFVCSIQNRKPNFDLDPKLEIKQFISKIQEADINSASSPARLLSDLFWKHLPWDRITDEIGLISAFDSGCGSGRYGSYLDLVSNGRISRYKGVDVYEHANWENLKKNTKFMCEKYNGKQIQKHIPPETNFFMSQSAIEHFANDLRYFKDVKTFIEIHPERAIMQVHLIPSAACMKLYGRHGYRQYTPRTISKITRMFPDAQCILFGLGGPACNRVHKKYITDTDLRKTNLNAFKQNVFRAITEDDQMPPTDPSFWALVICSNLKKPLSL